MTQIGIRLSVGLLFAALAAPAAAQAVGANAVVVNEVQMASAAGAPMRATRVRDRVSLANVIQTGRASRLQILLLDGTSFQVGANARLTVDRFVYDPARSASEVGVDVARGSFRFASGASTRNRPGRSGVRTPVASIGVRGTIFEGVVGEDAIRLYNAESGVPEVVAADPETASLVVLRGPGVSIGGHPPGAIDVTAGGRTVPVDAVGYAVFIPGPDQAPIGPFLLSDNGLIELSVLLGDLRPGVRVPELDPLVSDPLFDGDLDTYEGDVDASNY